ncbi:MAG: methyltransferase domain-containing protein [Candidatus Rokubacteria bacterium]|nr:methyltransferase domain-containing protein [Candidatus Rokubacteria bacterium]
MSLHPDPYRAIDRQPDPSRYVKSLEARGETRSQTRLREHFLRFARVKPGWRVLEVGSGTGVICRDLGRIVGPRGAVVGVDPSRVFVEAARRLARTHGVGDRVRFVVGDGERLRFREGAFDAALAVTVLLHVPRALAVLREMIRVTRPGGIVGVQDQDFGTLALDHPDRALTRRILDGVAMKIYADPWSGRTLFGTLRRLGLRRVRLSTDVYQDTRLEPWTKSMLERRAEHAVALGLVGERQARRWLETLEAQARAGSFVLTLNFYGVVGVKPG